MADIGEQQFPLHVRLILVVASLALCALVIVVGVAFIFLAGMAWFFWGWDGERVIPSALLALAIAVGAGWLSAKLIRKVDRLSKPKDHES